MFDLSILINKIFILKIYPTISKIDLKLKNIFKRVSIKRSIQGRSEKFRYEGSQEISNKFSARFAH